MAQNYNQQPDTQYNKMKDLVISSNPPSLLQKMLNPSDPGQNIASSEPIAQQQKITLVHL